MKKANSRIIKKILLILIVIIQLFIFITPQYVYAADTSLWEQIGGIILYPIRQLVCAIGDGCLNILIRTFISSDPSMAVGENGQFTLCYSPGIIFSGQVRGLDINFIDPLPRIKQKKWELMESGTDWTYDDFCSNMKNNYGYANPEGFIGQYYAFTDRYFQELKPSLTLYKFTDTWQYGKDVYILYYPMKTHIFQGLLKIAEDLIGPWLSWGEEQKDLKVHTAKPSGEYDSSGFVVEEYDETFTIGLRLWKLTDTENYNVSIAEILRPIVSSWYKATRRLSIVALMVVLLYVGIRIITSSTAGDKAKYKKMFMDWLTALCMLFILHYIMIIILFITRQISSIFTVTALDGSDPLMNNIRQHAIMEGDYTEEIMNQVASTVLYVAMVVYTFIFTFQYLRRVLYMAFLTMIAPLIALTYPLDKIKDGQAQAFTMWLREFVFNCLIQPIHLIIYVMLVGTAVNVASTNPVYALVAIGFIVPAEKHLRQMFGFEKSSTVGSSGAAIAGAAVMNAINKVKGIKESNSEAKQQNMQTTSSSLPRQATSSINTDYLRPLQNLGTPTDSEPNGEGGASSILPGNTETETVMNGDTQNNTQEEGEQIGFFNNTNSDLNMEQTDQGENANTRNALIRNAGAGTLQSTRVRNVDTEENTMRSISAVPLRHRGRARRIFGAINAVGKRYKLWGRGSIRQWNKRIIGTVGAGTLGMIGMAAGLATGDLSNVFKYGGAGVAAGYAAGNGITDKVSDNLEDLGETMVRGYEGEEEYTQEKIESDFYKSNSYLMLKQKYKSHKNLRKYTSEMLKAGIRDVRKIDKALEVGLSSDKAIAYITLARMCPPTILNNRNKFEDFLEENNIDKDNSQEIYNNMRLFS